MKNDANCDALSLKKFLNTYMGSKKSNTDIMLSKLCERFEKCVDFLFTNIGKSAFHNISPTNPDKLVTKFSPTLFDSIMIATDQYLEYTDYVRTENLEAKRLLLLKDDEYQLATSKETMRVDNIQSRVNLAYSYLFKSYE